MNAIILAAGMGTRLRPLTNDIPKCLVSVLGTPMIERQILYLRAQGVEEIYLVSGYKGERLEYLTKQFLGVQIIENPRYHDCNNIYSMYVAQEHFGDSWVIEGDVFISENCLEPRGYSHYLAPYREHFEREWELVTDEVGSLQEIRPGSGSGFIMSGVSYWKRSDAEIIKAHLNEVVGQGGYEELFWDNIVWDVLPQLEVKVHECPYLHEIDTVDELRALEVHLTQG